MRSNRIRNLFRTRISTFNGNYKGRNELRVSAAGSNTVGIVAARRTSSTFFLLKRWELLKDAGLCLVPGYRFRYLHPGEWFVLPRRLG
jgi:hypothetical protein